MADNENQQKPSTGFWSKIQELLQDQTNKFEEVSKNSEQSINRQELLNALEEMKSELSREEDTEQFVEISRSIQQLKGIEEENLTPDIYKDIVGDLFEDFEKQQTSILGNLSSKIGGLGETIGNKVSNVFNIENITSPIEKQTELTEQMSQNVRENVDKDINKQDLLDSLEEMKSELDRNEDQEMLGEIGRAINQLKSFEEENLTPEMYRPIVGDLFDEANERQGTLLQNILEELPQLNEAMQSGFGRIQGVIGDAFAPLSELKEFTVGLFEVLKGGFEKVVGIFDFFRGSNEEEKQVSILDRIKGYMRSLVDTQEQQLELDQRQYKWQLRKDTTTGEGGFPAELLAFFGPMLTGVATALGGVFYPLIIQFKVFKKAFVDPFRSLTRWLSTTKFGGLIGRFIDRMGSFGRMIRGFLNYLSQAGRWIGKWTGKIASVTRLLGRGARWIPIIGQFITVIMGIVDFFRGFLSEEGNIKEKIKAGITKAFAGLVRLPVRIIGWIGDQLLESLFGVEIKGGLGKRMMGIVRDITSWFVRFIWNMWGWFVDALTLDWSGMQHYGQKIWEQIKRAVQSIFNVITWPFEKWVIEPLKDLWNWLTGGFDTSTWMQTIDFVKSAVQDVFSVITWPFRTFILQPIQSLISYFTSDQSKSGGIFDSIVNWASFLFSNISDWLIQYTPLGWVYSGIKKLWTWLSGGEEGEESSVFDTIMQKIKEVPGMIKDWVLGLIPGKEMLSDVTGTLGNIAGSIGNAAGSIWGGITNFDSGGEEGDEEKNTSILNKERDVGIVNIRKNRVEDATGAEGGFVGRGGLARIHAGEYVLPADTVDKMTRGQEIDRMDQQVADMKTTGEGTQNYTRQLIEYQRTLINKIEQNTNAIKKLQDDGKKETASTTEDRGGVGAPRSLQEPPDEIENLGILLFNKNYGIT